MGKQKTMLVFAGTRPEIIKMAPLIHELRAHEHKGHWTTHFCFTGQHLDLAQPLLDAFELKPHATLSLMEPGQSLGQLTSRAAQQLDKFLDSQSQIAAAFVQGDTTTAFTAALTAFYHRIPVGHIEAGLRTSSTTEPFPEELNRRMISRIAAWNFAPTESAKENLLREHVDPRSVFVTGNTGVDAFLWMTNKVATPPSELASKLAQKKSVLITIHRRENIGKPLENICTALQTLATRYSDHQFVLPVHPNPQVKQTIEKNLSKIPNIHLTKPLEYNALVWFMKQSVLILSDSGGIQEEAPSLKKPVLVLRNETERPEAIDHGTSFIVGSNTEKIVALASEFLDQKRTLQLKTDSNPFGDGTASQNIVNHLLKIYGA